MKKMSAQERQMKLLEGWKHEADKEKDSSKKDPSLAFFDNIEYYFSKDLIPEKVKI